MLREHHSGKWNGRYVLLELPGNIGPVLMLSGSSGEPAPALESAT